jgi:hypothetical protein
MSSFVSSHLQCSAEIAGFNLFYTIEQLHVSMQNRLYHQPLGLSGASAAYRLQPTPLRDSR